ncbi:MAG: AraC family transcriptional regulator [Tannerellaceae bacterium]|jgi:AraC-like DNA-binding protein|nr:AraC family transcriptional regulator [Tannerellaceae bacterium]
MEIQNVSEHLRCYNYDNGDRPTVECRTIEKNTTWEIYTEQNKLLFLLEGKVQVEVGSMEKQTIGKGFFWFASGGQDMKIRASANALLLILRINSRASLCDCYIMEQLYNEFQGKAEASVDVRQLYPCLIRTSLWYCLKGLYSTTADGLCCRFFFEAKVKEVFFLFRAYYPKVELYRLFHPILTSDIIFSDNIKNAWQKYPSVDALARAMNLTPSGFYKRFTSIFGQPPHDWLTQQKKTAVYNDLASSYMNLKEVASKWGFSSQSTLSDWCVKIYGMPPGKIRKQLLSPPELQDE